MAYEKKGTQIRKDEIENNKRCKKMKKHTHSWWNRFKNEHKNRAYIKYP